jgi:hypothetical protein
MHEEADDLGSVNRTMLYIPPVIFHQFKKESISFGLYSTGFHICFGYGLVIGFAHIQVHNFHEP